MDSHPVRLRKAAAAAVCAVLVIAGISASLSVAETADLSSAASIGKALGGASLIPAAITILLAFCFQDVILSLLAGLVSGVMMWMCLQKEAPYLILDETCTRIVNTIADRNNVAVLISCLAIGGMVEVIRRSGGFEQMAEKMVRKVNSARKASLVGELLGVIVFFDDYANSLIVGPVMKPITDKLNVSREKLAYIVDSTAAPVSGIAIISSWVAVEVSVINQGLENAQLNLSGYQLFLQAIPFCFYCIFCLIFILESSLTGREFGPMLEAETRARNGQPLRRDSEIYEAEQKKQSTGKKTEGKVRNAVVPLVVLFVYALIMFYVTGIANAVKAGLLAENAPFTMQNLSTAFGQADTVFLIFEATMLGTAVAVFMGIMSHAFTLKEAIDTFISGCAQILPTAVILTTAWALSGVVKDLGTVYYAVGVISGNMPWQLVPAFLFLSCCAVSFAVGSFGCMFIALPMAVPIAASMVAQNPALTASYLPLCIGCSLTGCIFGDHCSPITDCTILSSQGAGCDNFDHVKTQLPYALTTAAVSVIAGILPSTFGVPAWASILLGSLCFYLILNAFGQVPGMKPAAARNASLLRRRRLRPARTAA